METIALIEHTSRRLARSAMTEEQGLKLHRAFSRYVAIEFPTPKTQGMWELTPRGVAGALSIDEHLAIAINPKVPVSNLARMLVVAYELHVDDFDGLVTCGTVDELYEQLVRMLTRQVRGLLREGVYHEYHASEHWLPVIRGRLRVVPTYRRLGSARISCVPSERTADITENRLLLWTMDRILRSRLCSPELQAEVRSVHRALTGGVSLVTPARHDWISLRYNRLSERYRPAHALCRLLLEGTSPVAEMGGTTAVPFLLEMPRLFESFVTNWLRDALPPGLMLVAQERSAVGSTDAINFFVDLVIYDDSGRARCVLDAKYKDADVPAADDVAQVGYYALLKQAPLAGLVFPVRHGKTAWSGVSGQVHTFRTSFDLAGDLRQSGMAFLQDLMNQLHASPPAAGWKAFGDGDPEVEIAGLEIT